MIFGAMAEKLGSGLSLDCARDSSRCPERAKAINGVVAKRLRQWSAKPLCAGSNPAHAS